MQDPITDLLKKAKNIAVVGLSSSPLRPSYGVSAYMQSQGYRIFPVNPHLHEAVLGEEPFASLQDVPGGIDGDAQLGCGRRARQRAVREADARVVVRLRQGCEVTERRGDAGLARAVGGVEIVDAGEHARL